MKNFAILTATLEEIGDENAFGNRDLHEQLFAALLRQGYQFEVVRGFYKGVDQGEGFLIHDISERAALLIARVWSQESIITERGLVFTNGNCWPITGILTGAQAIASGNYTRRYNGFCFSFEISQKII